MPDLGVNKFVRINSDTNSQEVSGMSLIKCLIIVLDSSYCTKS